MYRTPASTAPVCTLSRLSNTSSSLAGSPWSTIVSLGPGSGTVCALQLTLAHSAVQATDELPPILQKSHERVVGRREVGLLDQLVLDPTMYVAVKDKLMISVRREVQGFRPTCMVVRT